MSAIHCALNPGESVIIADPYYPNYLGYFALAGVEVIAVPTKEEEHFHLTAEAIEGAIKPSTKAILINSPSNPTGAVCVSRRVESDCRACTEARLDCYL